MSSKKKIVISILILLFIFEIGVISYLFIRNKSIKHDVVFTLNGDEEITIEIGSNYEDEGCNLLVDSLDRTSDIMIDNSNLDINKLGTYKIKYYIVLDNKEYSITRNITVIDTTTPIITLNGSESITILKGEEYSELGYTASDNYDGDITDKVEVTSNLNNTVVGDYTITYTVSDTSNNTYEITRIVYVKEPKKVVVVSNTEEKEVKKEIKQVEDTITYNKFTSNGFYIEGIKNSPDNTYKLVLSGEEEYSFDLISIGSNKYKGDINISDVANGTYKLLIDTGERNNLINKLDFIDKIKRSKINDKLVTFNYDDSIIVTIEDFSYIYDVLIDVGHGGSDTGASNQYIYEKDMNLRVSLYEKCRYESLGYNVYMTRESDTYGSGMGDSSLPRLHKRAYEVGYYGVVSKIVYSNHHNAIGNNYYNGYEILVPASLTSSQLSNELTIMNKFNSIYPNLDNHLRFYGRDYDTEKKYNMTTGNTYSFKDNYAINRIPLTVFNVKSIIYEGCYLTNKDDYNWYWNNNGWIKVSEAKIETYVNYLGGTYNSDNSSCLS